MSQCYDIPTISVDKFGHAWNLPTPEMCPVCWQPDNCGECDHQPISDEQAEQLGAERVVLHPSLREAAKG